MDTIQEIEAAEVDEMLEMIIVTVERLSDHYQKYMNKQPCMDSFQTGYVWLLELIRGNEKRCINMFRMDKETLLSLCTELEGKYGLTASNNISILEKVCMFLYQLALAASNRQVQERFQYFSETVSRNFHEVLQAVLQLSSDLIRPHDLAFTTIPPEIENDERYMPYFKDCIGAIDGTHIPAVVSAQDAPRFIGRKGIATQNIMAVCSFDMQFIFVLAGWEGTAHDARIFRQALSREDFNFPKPPPGKYYLVDAGYPQMQGFLGPYKGIRYHLPEFQRGGGPKGPKEMFNRWHSSLRCCIERTFGVWKARWKILRVMPPFSFKVQRNIAVATMALHNYIRRKALDDIVFTRFEENPDFVPIDNLAGEDYAETSDDSIGDGLGFMNVLRDQIRDALVQNKS